MRVFEDRAEAGRVLGAEVSRHLRDVGRTDRAVVLAVPRGGLPVAVEVADVLGAPLDVVVVRKLRAPHNSELGFGAVGPDGHVTIDEEAVARLEITPEEVDAEVADRRRAVESRLAMYRQQVDAVDLRGATVVVVDDGVATGGTAEQALALVRAAGADYVVLATPTAPADAVTWLGDLADAVVVVSTPAEFLSVGQAYRDFPQLDDEAVLASLAAATGGG